ncbi:MAG: hypothetical protein ACJAS4_000925 [Bacteriovoracaceae bacterium]|jgi:hypothetical protein
MKKIKVAISAILLSSTVLTPTFAANYCAGVRGNGELAPAHWSSMARIVENKGMPSTVAGGSSAAISIFLLDALSRNENLSRMEDKKRNEQALLLKTLVPHILYLYEEDVNAPTIMRLVSNLTGMGDAGFLERVRTAVKIAKDLPQFMKILGEYGPLLNPELAKGLKRNFTFYKAQISEAVKVFGSFDAQNDKNIFYREGLVDFKFLGFLFGRVADFYAGYGSVQTNTNLTSFLDQCAQASEGIEWKDLVKSNPECRTSLYKALNAYYEQPLKSHTVGHGRHKRVIYKKGKRVFPNKMIFSKVGSGIKAFPTTSIVVGSAAERYGKRLEEYEMKSAIGVKSFSLDFESELKYGYWGSSESLANVSENLKTLFPNDAKSKQFMGLEGGSWFEVLATSPAEPGLSNIARIPDGNLLNPESVINKKYFKKFLKIFPTLNAISWFDEANPTTGTVPFRENIYSAGGWSDLHPTLVLKASGCEDIVYVTRQGGESVFGQQIFIRLTGYTDKIRFWKDIKSGNRKGWGDLTEEEENSPWNKLYNLKNPNSSFNQSIKTADAVYCTNWDKFNTFKGEVPQTLTDAFYAPVFVKDASTRENYDFGYDSKGKSVDGFPGCILKKFK